MKMSLNNWKFYKYRLKTIEEQENVLLSHYWIQLLEHILLVQNTKESEGS